MNRTTEILAFFCIAIGLLTSGTTEKKAGSVNHNYVLPNEKHDTTGLISLLEVYPYNLTIITPSLGIQYYKNGILFLSRSKNEVKMTPSHVSFGSIEAYFAIPGDSGLGKQLIFSKSPLFPYPSEALTFNAKYNTMYFTMIPKKGVKEKIYMAKFISNGIDKPGWVPEKLPLGFCSDNSSYTHPALSIDEKEMIFASDKEGSLGGMDLFVTIKDGDIWSPPQNLGNIINTTGNECFPYLDADNNLYYSSDGLSGYGGYDIFTCRFNGETWDKPMNLSSRINTENDEIAFTISRIDGKTAFFSRIMKSGKNSLQLYRLKLNKKTAVNNLLTVSYIYNGPHIPRNISTVQKQDTVKKAVEVAITQPEADKKLPEMKEVVTAPKSIAINKEPTLKPPEAKAFIIKPTLPTPDDQKDVVIYRVQYLSSIRPQKNSYITINTIRYKIYEYFYLGEYRYTIGEFRTLEPAKQLQKECRLAGLQAFVAAFKNDTRSLDLNLFK